jgi:hypothetical protein
MSSDTVFGQGTNPKPEDETYLNLLKKTVVPKKIKIKMKEIEEKKTKKEEEEVEMKKFKTTIDYRMKTGSNGGATAAPDWKDMH